MEQNKSCTFMNNTRKLQVKKKMSMINTLNLSQPEKGIELENGNETYCGISVSKVCQCKKTHRKSSILLLCSSFYKLLIVVVSVPTKSLASMERCKGH